MSENKVLYVGHYLAEEDSFIYKMSWNKPQLNAYRFQTTFLKQLVATLNSNDYIEIINLGSNGLFLKSNPFVFFANKVTYFSDIYRIYSIPYINIPVFRFITRAITLFFRIGSNIISRKKVSIIYYSISFFNLFSNLLVKAVFNYDTAVYLVDAPDWLYEKRYKKNLISRLLKYMLNKFDYYIIINHNLTNNVIKSNNFVLLQGSLNYDFIYSFQPNFNFDCNKKIKLVYAGSLLDGFGIRDFIIDFVNRNITKYEFHFAGPTSEYILLSELNIESYESIFYYGYLSSSQIVELYKIADFFVVPRKAGLAINLYSFPSKMHEFLSFGRPIVCYEMECFDQKWSELLIYAKNSILDKLDEILEHNSYTEIYDNFCLNRDRFISNQYERKAIEKFMKEFIGNV